MDFSEITSPEELEAAITEANETAAPLIERARSGEALTTEERETLTQAADTRDAAQARLGELQVQAEADAVAQADLVDRFTEPEAEAEVEVEVEPEPEPAQEPEASTEDAPAEPAPPAEPVAEEAPMPESLAAAGNRPPARRPVPRPEVEPTPVAATTTAITAAANVSGYGIGAEMSMDDVGEMFTQVAQRMPKPNGDGKSENLIMAPLATFTVSRPEEYQLTGNEQVDNERIAAALDPDRVVGGNGEQGLIAAGGWCAPSETLYNIPVVGESLDGMLSIPEMGAARGGIRTTTGPDFATLYGALGFHQTEAQAIAGTAKPCYEVGCPAFTETRLDIEGVCIKVPILTVAGYPEFVNRITSGGMVVHAHKINAFKLAQIATGSTAITATGLGSTAFDLLEALELRAEFTRQKYRMSFTETLEVVLDHWVLPYLRTDMSRRTGIDPKNPVTDAIIAAHFAASNLSVQYVYDWNTMPDPMSAAPESISALIYPAGTWLGLTKDVINLSSVYDAASLSTNVYTGLFTEEGVAVRKMSGVSGFVTVPLCGAGRTGAADFTCA